MQPTFNPVILLHTFAALAALALGAGVLLARKGSFTHRMAGRSWVALMLVVAVSSFWIRSSGSFSWIHLLSLLVPLLLALGVYFAITQRTSAHRRMMTGVYVGALVITGFFTLLPQRLLGRLVWSTLGIL